MLDSGSATTRTTAPASKSAGFPPFDTKTFESQLFWLTITFGVLFVVLWRLVGPRIQGVIGERRKHIADDLAAAQTHRHDAELASSAYQAALTAARGRAHALAEENRKRMNDEIARAKAQADADAHAATAKADERIAVLRAEAKVHMIKAAQEAAAQIVTRLTGDIVTAEDAAAAMAGN